MSTQIAENYQLKWHSHLTNLNTSVATLFRNERFADVLLLTSNPDGGTGIPAHKIILSSCSHYFASIFDANPSPPNAMLYIVLPPELSKRSIQILIQYMYSGEATVSNDILNEVLRGGELLKIRGLWRNNNQTNDTNASSTPSSSSTAAAAATSSSSSSSHPSKTIDSNKDGLAIGVEKSVFEHRLPERISTGNSAVIKESPVIVMSPQPSHQHLTAGQLSTVQTQPSLSTLPSLQPPPPQLPQQQTMVQLPPKPQQLLQQQNVLVKRENIVVEQSDNNSSPLHYGLVSLQIAAAAVKKAQLPSTDTRIKSATSSSSSTNGGNENANVRRYSTDQMKDSEQRAASKENELSMRLGDKRRVSIAEQQRSGHHLEPGEKSARYSGGKLIMDKKNVDVVQIPEALSFLTIKQEPIEWNDYDAENGIEKSHIEVTVKPEIIYPNEESEDEEEQDEMIYSPLTCELCSETFTVPADWVRHIESHTEATHCVPKKRKRIDVEASPVSENIAALRCDLCSMFFVTPAEWVRHVQNTHTETELALSNNSTPPKRNNRPLRHADGQPLDKTCSICKKSFPSYASMIIHKRTHTGERPFYCSLCDKGFNVKSNLLRHMRTLHNQLLNPSNVNDCPDTPGNLPSSE